MRKENLIEERVHSNKKKQSDIFGSYFPDPDQSRPIPMVSGPEGTMARKHGKKRGIGTGKANICDSFGTSSISPAQAGGEIC
jgi:hypothetical protein